MIAVSRFGCNNPASRPILTGKDTRCVQNREVTEVLVDIETAGHIVLYSVAGIYLGLSEYLVLYSVGRCDISTTSPVSIFLKYLGDVVALCFTGALSIDN